MIAVKGELDTDTCAQFQQDVAPVQTIQNAKVEVDFSELDYISSKALRVIISLQQAVLKNGGSFSIPKVSDTVREVFQMTGLSQSLFVA